MPRTIINARALPTGRPPERVRLKRIHLEEAFDAIDTDVLLCAPRDDRSAGYYGIARFTQLDPDLSDPNFVLVRLEEFLPFLRPVPLLHAGRPFEEAAQGDNGNLLWWVYAQGIRFVTDQTFANILAAASLFGDRGLQERAQADYVEPPSLSDQLSTRELESTKRRKRDARLRMLVLPLYDARCALTGDRFTHAGAEEVEICHLRGLDYGGSDAIRNAMAMGRTVHWCYDHGLLGLENDGTIIFASSTTADFRARFKRQRAAFPLDPNSWPDPDSLEFHRDVIFRR